MTSQNILYVEDEETDVMLLDMALQGAAVMIPFTSVADGVAAIDYLAGNRHYSDRSKYPFPSIVLLDLNLPKVSGFEVLEWIRAQPAMIALPVLICTSSDRPEDRDKARVLGATDYLVKDASFAKVVARLRATASD